MPHHVPHHREKNKTPTTYVSSCTFDSKGFIEAGSHARLIIIRSKPHSP